VKQRFSVWYNRSHQRYGTLWSERFKSVLVEPQGRALETMATYIDLNCVRAGLASDPKDYRFCGYAEAVAGNTMAQAGLLSILGGSWPEAQATYRHWLFGTATEARESGAVIDAALLEKVIAEGGRLPLSTVLRCRIRYFTDGAVLGSKAFVESHLLAYRAITGRRERTAVRPIPPVAEWGSPLATLRALRKHAFAEHRMAICGSGRTKPGLEFGRGKATKLATWPAVPIRTRPGRRLDCTTPAQSLMI